MVKQRLEAKKISELDLFGKDAQNWLLSLRYVWKCIGLPPEKYPPEDEITILTNRMQGSFGQLTLEEFTIAFDLCVDGKTNADANCYHTFSPLYMANVLNAYIEWRKPVIAEVNKLRLAEQNKPKVYTPEESLELDRRFMFNFIAKPYFQYLKDSTFAIDEMCINQVFSLLEEKGVIKMTTEQKNEMAKDVWKNFNSIAMRKLDEANNTNFGENMKLLVRKAMQGGDDQEKTRMVRQECRRIVLQEFFRDHKEKQRDILLTLGLKEWLKTKK